MEDYRARFVEIYNKNITRPGADRLLSWLETTDFFTAPASTRYHGACECGPPGELERLVCRAGPVGILVLVAAVTAAVGVAGVCVARPLILILHTMLLLQYFPFRQYRTILSADMACHSRRSGA